MNKKIIIIIITTLIVLIGGLGLLLYLNVRNSDYIPNDYIAVFNGGTGETTYSTYIYKIDNGQSNFGFKYINTTNINEKTEVKIKVTNRGEVDWTDNVFGVAKENNAYSYVTLPNSDKKYSIEEFQNMFLMN